MSPKVSIIDFGSSCSIKDRKYHSNRTEYFETPEDIIGYAYKNQSCDIWALACTIFELLTGRVLFDADDGDDNNSSKTYQLLEMQKLLGPIPEKIRKDSKRSSEFYYNNGILKGVKNFEQNFLTDRLKKSNMNNQEIIKATKFLLPMLDYYPQNRPSAEKCYKNLGVLN